MLENTKVVRVVMLIKYPMRSQGYERIKKITAEQLGIFLTIVFASTK